LTTFASQKPLEIDEKARSKIRSFSNLIFARFGVHFGSILAPFGDTFWPKNDGFSLQRRLVTLGGAFLCDFAAFGLDLAFVLTNFSLTFGPCSRFANAFFVNMLTPPNAFITAGNPLLNSLTLLLPPSGAAVCATHMESSKNPPHRLVVPGVPNQCV